METGQMKQGQVETAATMRGSSTFPDEWGFPPGRQFSEERARWIKERVTEHMALTRLKRRAAAVAVKAEHFREEAVFAADA